MQVCSHCRSKVTPGYKFCKSCGAKANTERTDLVPQQSVNNAVEEVPAPLNFKATNQVKEPSIDLIQAGSYVVTPSHEPSSSSSLRTKKLRIRIILASSLIFAALLLIGGYWFGNYWTSNEQLISRFEKAVQSQDYKVVASMFTSEEENLVINEQTVKSYVDYLKENNELFSNIKKDLRMVIAGHSPVK